MHNYAGNSASYPATIPLIDDSDPPDASHFDPGPEALADRTAYLKLRALDKTGDTISGHVHIGNGAELEVDSGGEIVVDSGGNEYVDGHLEIRTGGDIEVDVGATGTVRGVVSAVSSGSILAAQTAAVRSTVDGGIEFAGSSADYGSLSPSRTKSYTWVIKPSDPTALDATHWLSPGYQAGAPPVIVGQASATVPIYLEIPNPHEGATLASVSVGLLVVGVHSGVPASLPSLSVQRVHLVPGSALPAPQTLKSTDSGSGIPFSPTPATGAAWHDSGNLQELVYSCDQNHTIDNVNYVYFLVLTDEHGSNAVAGNTYVYVKAQYTNISDLRFAC